MLRAVASILVMLAVAPVCQATDHAGLEKAMAQLVRTLSGVFDSQAQKLAEEQQGTPEELVHGWVNRSFLPVDAPELGQHVFVATVRYNGPEGMFDNGEFQVWTVAVDPEQEVVKMSPRRFKNPEPLIAVSRDASAFTGLTPKDLLPPQGAAGCDILWRMDGTNLRGHTDPNQCRSMSSTMNIPLSWQWDYLLEDDALWISYAGRNDAGEIVNGRPDQLPWRLDRVR